MAILQKIKEKLKNIIAKGRISKQAASSKEKAKESNKNLKVIMGTHETAIEKTKFSHPEVPFKPRRSMAQELPLGYGQDKMVLQVRDPRWLHTYWEVTEDTWNKLRYSLSEAFLGAKRVIRVYDVSLINFDGTNDLSHFDIEVNYDANNWYIDTNGPGRSWCVDYGLRLSSGEFITILRSNVVHTPLDGPSWITDEEWMIPDDMFGRLYGMGFGLGKSSPVGKAWQERVKKALFSGALSSPGITSVSSPVRRQLKKFWLVADCELIVYGATEPDAKVTVQGKPIHLRPDGTFTLRFALPDGKQVIPVKAVSADGTDERAITPTVTRETKIG